jgi:hypothetical protein
VRFLVSVARMERRGAPRNPGRPLPDFAFRSIRATSLLTLANKKGTIFFLRSREESMVRAVVEEAAALASVALFVGMIAIWAQFIAAL